MTCTERARARARRQSRRWTRTPSRGFRLRTLCRYPPGMRPGPPVRVRPPGAAGSRTDPAAIGS
ncbi:hypothetical protein STXM2123_2340 [Streptomyces sp. F-3]|nr:hypothetical protein STXM2123_2340 [Streptomyces sp. F-3]